MDVKAFFDDVLRQNPDLLKRYFCEDAVIRWHCSNEQFTPDEYIKVNCEYPNRWYGQIERIEYLGDMIVMAARVFPVDDSASYHVVSFIRLKDDRIMTLDEYWADDGDAPEWRKKMKIGRPIRSNKNF